MSRLNYYRKDLTGIIFGDLLVIEYDNFREDCKKWKCICKCGKIKYMASSNLTSNKGTICRNHYTFKEHFENLYSSYQLNKCWSAKNEFSPDEITYKSGRKIILNCPDCRGEIESTALSVSSRGIVCRLCGDGLSYPTKLMISVLKQMGVDFKREYSPAWIKPKRYDFYIPSKNLIIEMDGELGHGNRMHGKSKISLIESIEIDKFKDDKAIANGIKLIRIDCIKSDLEYIKSNIFRSELIMIFGDLIQGVDWNKVKEDCLTSNIIKAIELWNNNVGLTTDIGKILMLSEDTIRNYLKIGNELGMCCYNPSNYMNEGCKHVCKNVEILKDGVVVGMFESREELSRVSHDLFGVKLLSQHISNVCNGKRKSHRGFTFRNAEAMSAAYGEWE